MTRTPSELCLDKMSSSAKITVRTGKHRKLSYQHLLAADSCLENGTVRIEYNSDETIGDLKQKL